MPRPLPGVPVTPSVSVAEVVLEAGAVVGEGALWDPRQGRLLWVDIPRQAIHSYDPASGSDAVADTGQPVGAVGLRESPGVIAAVRDGFAIWDGTGLHLVAAVETDQPGTRMNDGKVDPGGRFWAGTMALDERAGAGALYRLDPDYQVHVMLDGLTISNGLDWSPDGTRMYYIDSGTGGVDVFDFDADAGTISNRTRLITVRAADGVPDGMTVDADGFLWVAFWGGAAVRRYTSEGSLAATIQVPASQVTSCCFGGGSLDELYITSASEGLPAAQPEREPHAGAVFVCRPGVAGRPANRFRG